MIINSLKELNNRKVLKHNDIVIFCVKNIEYTYTVEGSLCLYLVIKNGSGSGSGSGSGNATIFTVLGIKDKYKFCSELYGYETNTGHCPITRERDYKGLTRMVEALYKIIEEKTEKKCLCLETISRFELMDFD